MRRRAGWIERFAITALCLVAVAALGACSTPQADRITLENRTNQAVLAIAATPYGERRYLVPACERVAFDPRGTAAPASSSPPGAAVVPVTVSLLPDAAVLETIVIASDRVWPAQLGAQVSVPPCEGVPPSPSP